MTVQTHEQTPRQAPMRTAVGTIVLVVLVALGLRPPVTSIAPLLPDIVADLRSSPAFGGVLTTLPVVCLGVFAFAAPLLRRRWGDEKVLAGCLVVLVIGNAVRAVGNSVALLSGTVVVGVGIAVANVALPALIKRDFPGHVPAVTAAYTMCLTLGGALAASAVVPLGGLMHSSWQGPLGLLAIPVLLALVVSVVVLRGRGQNERVRLIRPGALWRDRTAWHVTAFMGVQALLAYVVFGWLPSMVQGRGMSAETAGMLLGVQAAIQAVGSMLVPVLCRRFRDQRLIAVSAAVLTALGFVGILLGPAPAGVWVSTVVLGIGQGAAFGLALTLFGLRSPDSDTTTALSGMAQGAGYLLAAVGPLAIGLLHGLTADWMVPLALLLTCCAIEVGAGLLAGRRAQVRALTG